MQEATVDSSHKDAILENAAILVTLLGEEESRWILSQLEPKELQRLGSAMCALNEIGSDAIEAAIRSFAENANRVGPPPGDSHRRVEAMMTGALGEMKAQAVMSRIGSAETALSTPAIELAKWLQPKTILPLVADEHPQMIALLLVQLEPEDAAVVLSQLPEDLQTEVVHRIARLGPVSKESLEILNDTLQERIEKNHGAVPVTVGGVCEAARIINAAASAVEKRIIPAIGKIDRALADDLERELFRFEDLCSLDAQSMGQLLREVENETLIKALKGLNEPLREPFFAAMSTRAADGVRDEIDSLGRIRRDEAQEAQRDVIATAKRLIENGTLALGGGDDDFV
ncbi:flagellar motor switch protein FliG [Sphingomicrobium astaxanthinifaciens]|uniref:flagellar motor switch protein FliG n=1 Tax=Sphingomicrobium astaxanthinifaciens TaxID=1227949 RepID=UPI001FCC28E4|nr:FliG C-terminal domain-containing protein [Sphingomicrobium astaxanthinifaciens]MCJ7420366.1 flagellar motor switch protein FliG [Sphingomicrobium astaxanthinifaciens]